MVIIDDSYVLSLLDSSDKNHKKALFLLKRINLENEVMIISRFTLNELVNADLHQGQASKNLSEFIKDTLTNKIPNLIFEKDGVKDYHEHIKQIYNLFEKLNLKSGNYYLLSVILDSAKYNNAPIMTFNVDLISVAVRFNIPVYRV